MHEAVLTTTETAQALKCTPGALARMRRERRGPAFVRVGRLIRYRPVDLDAWLKSRRIAPVREAKQA